MGLINDATAQQIKASLDLRFHRQQLLASNVANIDTPNYQPRDLRFEGALRDALADDSAQPPGFDRTDARHLPGTLASTPPDPQVIERPDVTNTLDGNGVDLDREMGRLTDNSLRFNAALESGRRRFQIMNFVIAEMTT